MQEPGIHVSQPHAPVTHSNRHIYGRRGFYISFTMNLKAYAKGVALVRMFSGKSKNQFRALCKLQSAHRWLQCCVLFLSFQSDGTGTWNPSRKISTTVPEALSPLYGGATSSGLTLAWPAHGSTLHLPMQEHILCSGNLRATISLCKTKFSKEKLWLLISENWPISSFCLWCQLSFGNNSPGIRLILLKL